MVDDKLDKGKYVAVLKYLFDNVPDLDMGLLCVLLYFIDMNFYELYEEYFIGEDYLKTPDGIVPVHLMEVLSELVE